MRRRFNNVAIRSETGNKDRQAETGEVPTVDPTPEEEPDVAVVAPGATGVVDLGVRLITLDE